MYGHLMRHPGKGHKGATTRPAASPTALVAGGGVTPGTALPPPLKEGSTSLSARSTPGAAGLKEGLPAMAMRGPAPTAAYGVSAVPPAVVEPARGEEEEDAAMALLGMSSGPATATLKPAKVHTQLTLVPGALVVRQMSGLELLAAMATAAPEVAEKPTEPPEPVGGDAPVVVREKRRLVLVAPSPVAKKPKMRRLDDLLQLPPNPTPTAEAMEVEPPLMRRVPSPVPDRKKYACGKCGMAFPTFQALGGHVSSHNKVSMFSRGQKQLDGSLAAAHAIYFHSYMAQQQHQQGQGGGGAVVLGAAGGSGGVRNFIPPPLPEARDRMQHPCTRCTLVFSTGQALGGHMRVHWTAEMQAGEAMAAVAAALAAERERPPAVRPPRDFDLNELPMEE